MERARSIVGYLIGFTLFVVLVPALMWFVAGGVSFSTPRTVVFVVLAVAGLGLSLWSIVYMKRVGKGHPMDAFNHEFAPRTSELMTSGPYAFCRNPMVLGVIVYYLGVLVLLGSAKPLIVFAIYLLIMGVQVSREEVRLQEDFGQAYSDYKKTTKRLIPFIW